MAPVATPNFIDQQSFSDFDELCEDIQDWDLDLQQLDLGRFSADILQYGCANSYISEARFHRRLLQYGAPPPGLRTIVVPVNSDLRITWRGHMCTGNDLLIFPRGSELDSVSDENFHVITCSFPEELLAEVCAQNSLAQLDQLRDGYEVVRCSSKQMTRIRQLLQKISLRLRSNTENIHSPETQYDVNQRLPSQILSAIAESKGTDPMSVKPKRQEGLILALQSIHRQAHEAITIREICKSTNISQRTLEYAFLERFGVTPKTYLNSYRLNQVRRLLRKSEPWSTSVTDAANQWGFWHMGQFAADYNSFFGELPSKTLNTA